VIWALFAVASATTCPAPTTNAELQELLDRAEAGYRSVDVEAFSLAFQEASLVLPCLNEVVATDVAATYHRMRGVDRFVRRDLDQAAQSFAASRAASPGADLDLAGPKHPIQTAFRQIDIADGRFETLADPSAGSLALDGNPSNQRPLDWPVIVQTIVDGSAVHTTYGVPGTRPVGYTAEVVRPGREDRPPPLVAPEPEPVVQPKPEPNATITPRNLAWVAPATVTTAAVGMSAVTAVTGARTLSKYGNYVREPDDDVAAQLWPEITRLKRASRVEIAVSAALIGTSVVLWSVVDWRVSASGQGVVLQTRF
jgi:hypothetical protein